MDRDNFTTSIEDVQAGRPASSVLAQWQKRDWSQPKLETRDSVSKLIK